MFKYVYSIHFLFSFDFKKCVVNFSKTLTASILTPYSSINLHKVLVIQRIAQLYPETIKFFKKEKKNEEMKLVENVVILLQPYRNDVELECLMENFIQGFFFFFDDFRSKNLAFKLNFKAKKKFVSRSNAKLFFDRKSLFTFVKIFFIFAAYY